MLHEPCFWVKHILVNYLWDYVFLKSVVLWPYCIRLYMKSALCLILHMGKCMNIWLGKEKYPWIYLIVGFMDLWYYLELLSMFCVKLYYLGNWCKFFLTRNAFEGFENIVDIWLLKYLMKVLGSKLYILNTFNLWVFMWVCPCAVMLVITSFLWW